VAKYQDPITKEVIEVGEPKFNPDLIAGKTLVPDTTPLGSISVSNLNSNPTPLNVPVPVFSPIDTTGSQATIDSFNKYLASSKAPESQLSSFLETLGISGETAGQEFKTAKAGVLSTQEAEQTAREELDAINAQLAGLSAESQAVPIRLQEEATGRGITAGGLAPIQAGELRKVALRTLSLQLPAYLAQAKLAAAQGKTALAQNAFSLATNQLNKIFELKTTDTTNAYNNWKDLNEKAYNVASDYQKNLLAKQQKEDDRKFTSWLKDKDDALDKAKLLMSTQPDLAAKISARVGQSAGFNDTTLGADVAKLMEGAKVKIEPDLQFVSATDNQPAGYFNKHTGQFTPLGIKGRGGAGVEEISPYQAERQTRNLQSVSELKLKVDTTPGIFGKTAALPIPSFLRSEGFRNFRAELDTLKANIAFGELTAMREASKTGGALGQVSDKEGSLLQAALGALDMTQSPENFKKQLQKINDSIVRWQTAMGKLPQKPKEEIVKEGSTQDWEGKTYKLINNFWVEQ